MTGKPDDISRLDPLKRVGDEQKMGTPTPMPGKSFEEYMEKAGQPPGAKPAGVSPFELAQGQTPLATGASFDSLLSQVKSAQGMLGDINNNLNTKNLKLKQSQRYLLRNKLQDANAHLRAANAKMGAEIPEPPKSTGGGVIGKFLDYVSEGQANLMSANQQLMNLKGKGDTLKPADFLAIQLKLAHAQQEIEYASIMLSKTVDDIRMLFNVQL
jgi:hypothetical protein